MALLATFLSGCICMVETHTHTHTHTQWWATGNASQLHVQGHYVRNVTIGYDESIYTRKIGKHYKSRLNLLYDSMSGLKTEVAYVNKADLFKPFIMYGAIVLRIVKKKMKKTLF